jgi:3-dehydrosphinganine reductase
MTLTSSAAGQVGVFGFTAYAPTKFALRGFAECLHMELSTQPISIQLAFPPDTNTPGYQQEQQLKPRECHLISESTGLYESSEYVVKS